MQLLQKVKESDQDFEWYPTTNEILGIFCKNVKRWAKSNWENSFSILDIGGGDGRVFKDLDNRFKNSEYSVKKYVIEKSAVLIESLDKDIFVIGTDFHHQTLIDKKFDVIFSNPPYSEFSFWAEKIIREANAKMIYLVLPQRWDKDKAIKSALQLRNGESKILGSFDFMEADRAARAKVDLIKIVYNERKESAAFDLWFLENFNISADKEDQVLSEYEAEARKRDQLQEAMLRTNIIAHLVKLYQIDLEKLMQNYKLITEVDSTLFRELNISIDHVKETLRLKIIGLKNIYWEELFNTLGAITTRLTEKSRSTLLETLIENTSVDFTSENIYSIVIWAIKHANSYFDSQLNELYLSLSSKDNIKLYKSNKRLVEDGWRYGRYYSGPDKLSHYYLDYRIVHHMYQTLETGSIHFGLSQRASAFIKDVFTVAKNLGFDVYPEVVPKNWQAGAKEVFYYKDSREKVFAEIRAYKNGNLHFKFVPSFMQKLNIEAARINKWIKQPSDAVREMGVPIETAEKYFNSNKVITKNNLVLLPGT